METKTGDLKHNGLLTQAIYTLVLCLMARGYLTQASTACEELRLMEFPDISNVDLLLDALEKRDYGSIPAIDNALCTCYYDIL